MPRHKSELDRFLNPRALARILIPEIQLLDHIREVGFFNRQALQRKGSSRRELAGKVRLAGTGAAAAEAAPGGTGAGTSDAGAAIGSAATAAVQAIEAAAVDVSTVASAAGAAIQAAVQTEKAIPRSEVDAAFDAIEGELSQYVLEQSDYIRDLCIAFKRPYVSGEGKSYKNLLFVCGPLGSGRHLSVAAITRLMRDRNLLARGTIAHIDLSKYATEKVADDLFLSDLYKALYGFDRVVVFDSPEKCHPTVLDKLTSLGVNGTLKLDKRYVTQFGKMAEVTGALMLGTTDEMQCNGKYLVFITEADEKRVEGMFPKAFMENVPDVISTKPLSERSLWTLARSYLGDCREKARANLGVTLTFRGLQDYVVRSADRKTGAHGIQGYIEDFIYRPLVELQLRKAVAPGESCELVAREGGLYLLAGGKEYDLGTVLRRRDEEAPEALDEEMDSVIGLDSVKAFIKDLEYNLKVQKMREAQGERPPRISLHMVFTGNPGTGKTTMARLVARYLKALGYLASGHLVEVSRADLIGQYVGETAQKTMAKIRSALGGVLFIDEAYSLARDKADIYGVEAVDTIVKAMEDKCRSF